MTRSLHSTAQTLDLDHTIDRLQTAQPPPALEPFHRKFIDLGIAIREALRAAEAGPPRPRKPRKPSLAREIDDGIAASLDEALREPYRRAVAIELQHYRSAEITPGLVNRVGKRLQREFSRAHPVDSLPPLPPLSPLELHRVVGLDEAARLSGLSVATLKLRHADKIRKLSPRRLGMRVGDALALQAAK